MAAVAFEIQHRVDHVLQHARAGDGAILGDVADQDQGEAGGFGEADQLEGGGADLRHGAGGAVDAVEPHGLDGVDHDQSGVARLFQAGGDVAQVDRGGEADLRVGDAEAPGAQAHLLDRFFARDVQHALAGTAEGGGGLQQHGGFADARIARDQHRRGGHEAAAQDAVEFGHAGGDAAGGAASPATGTNCRLRPGLAVAARPSAGSSAMVFQALQDSQWPAHLPVTAPQDWQT